jgi:Zn-dependent protease with chaperone function
MSLAVCLLAYSMVVTVLGPPLLSSVTRPGAAPRLGVAAWLVMTGSVLAAWVAAAVLFVTQLVGFWDQIGRVLIGCVAGLRLIVIGGYGAALQAGLLLLAALSVAALAVLAARVSLALHRSRQHTAAHAQAARLAAGDGPRGPGGALVIDSAQAAVYCLAGRPNTVVITNSALKVLDDDQLAAVLAHEHAHLTGRHHQLLALVSALAKILSRVRLFTDADADVARLLEMCADDAAARHHSPDNVVDALLALTLPGAVSPPVITPAVAMGAAGVGVAERVERLLFPPAPTRARIALTLTLAAVLLGPTLAAVMTVFVPMLCAI